MTKQAQQPEAEILQGADQEADVTAPSAPAEELSVEAHLAQAQAELAEMKDNWLRTAAEMENLRKRTARDVDDARKYGVANLVRDMLDVLENLYRAEKAVPSPVENAGEALDALLKGVAMTREELEKIFARQGLKRLEPAQGEAFNHAEHEAVARVPMPDVAPNCVIETVQAGYLLKDRLLRPAKVAVSAEVVAAENTSPAEDSAGS